MEGWKFLVAIAFLLAACSVNASSHDYDKCSDIICPPNLTGERFPCPDDKCGYCCCTEVGERATYTPCVYGGRFDKDTRKCVGVNQCGPCADAVCDDECLSWTDYPVKNPSDPCGYCVCHPNGPPTVGKCHQCWHKFDADNMKCVYDPVMCPCHCNNFTCPDNMVHDEIRFPNPDDPCGFCCCIKGCKDPKIRECPFHEMYDPTTNDCVPDPTGECRKPPSPSPPPHPSSPGVDPGRYKGCHGVPCPNDPAGVPLYPCDDPQYYCQCDWGGMVHQMPCAGGTVFSWKEQVCI